MSTFYENRLTTRTDKAGPQKNSTGLDLVLNWVYPRTDLPPLHWPRKEIQEIIIGRDPTCAIQLTSSEVSRHHAVLQWISTHSHLSIQDRSSRNGVRVNGRTVKQAFLGHGDVIRIGGWMGVLTDNSDEFREIIPGLWGGGVISKTLAPLHLVGPTDLPIILEGETGTGKEVVARALHLLSHRSGPFIGVNCAALPETLAEGELFGYRKGAFTSADRTHPGFFRSAEGGTLLLDEISDLSLPLQAKLLRVLEEKAVQPLGENRPIAINVRIVAASQKSLASATKEGLFRPDLLARLDGLTLRIPSLRQRKEDILKLFSLLLREFAPGPVPAFSADLAERLMVHDWPFNVRELYQLSKRLIILHTDVSTLDVHHLPGHIGEPAIQENLPQENLAHSSETGIKAPTLSMLLAALRSSGGNVALAAAMLGMTRQRAYRMMENHAVDLTSLRARKEKSL